MTETTVRAEVSRWTNGWELQLSKDQERTYLADGRWLDPTLHVSAPAAESLTRLLETLAGEIHAGGKIDIGDVEFNGGAG